MNEKTKSVCCIFGAGSRYGVPDIPEGSFIIAADGGYSYVKDLGLKPDLLLGDFDSLPVLPEGENILRYKKEKDETDVLLAVVEGLKRGFNVFRIYGGTGGRTEHTVANIQTLAYIANRGAEGCLYDDGRIITVIRSGGLSFDEGCKGYISVFAYGGSARGVNETGMKYSLTDATLTVDDPLGVSNEFTGGRASVSVDDGMLLIIYENKNY
ncbi:MAG: thiamine diphosphokinase [Clostridiales bacterium]|nr:thiamine diphosphokinase [Clostridiales bacterium]